MSQEDQQTPHYHGHRQRLKERFIKQGMEKWPDYEALELLLTWALPRSDVKPLAKNLINHFGSFSAVLDARKEDLTAVKGIGDQAALLIRFIKASANLYLRQKMTHTNPLTSPQAVLDYCRTTMQGLRDEQFRVIFLNSKNEVANDEPLSEGTINATAVYPRKVMERAIANNAAALIFVHNHPSGHPAPSQADKDLTRALVDAAQALQIAVHDHLIIGKYGHFSFRAEGLL